MNTKFNVKQWALASLAVFVISTIIKIVLNRAEVNPFPISGPQEQPDAMIARIAMHLSRLIMAGLFTYIFTKTTYESKSNLGHGLRFGFGMGLFLFVPNFIVGFVYSNMSMTVQITYLVVGVIQNVICGAAIALLYKSDKPAAT
jgi:hypothetical protein